MSVPLPPNEKVTVYRGTTVASPYPADGTAPALTNVPAYVKHHVKNGRFGNTPANLHWTHKLFIDLNDIRDAYGEELVAGPAEVVANGDTVLIGDYPLALRCCAFYVVFVCRQNRGGNDFLVAYLDRFQPSLNPCPKLPAQLGTISVPCCPNLLPATLHATLTNNSLCACLDGVVVPITWNGAAWAGNTAISCVNGTRVNVSLTPCVGPGNTWNVNIWCGTGAAPAASASGPATCSPFSFVITHYNGPGTSPSTGSCCDGSTPYDSYVNISIAP